MSTHFLINGREEDDSEPRSLLEVCDFCDARAGEPCYVDSVPKKYICPEEDCEQLYENANDALNCIR